MTLDTAVVTATTVEQHPCFSDQAHDRVGRIHLPVAPRCNIQCNFCQHRMCTDVQHPGWTARLLSEAEAVDLVRSVVTDREACDFVVGVAGPGDALANDETFRTLALIRRTFPEIVTCLCTNGLLLEEKLGAMTEAGVSTFTVTVNASDSRVGEDIYSWVEYRGVVYRGQEAATLLIDKQFRGIRQAIGAGYFLKVNTVLIPGVNDRHLPELARHLRDAGVTLMNILPLIPAGNMRGHARPTCEELGTARQLCGDVIPQFHRCRQCRADVVYLPQAGQTRA